MYHSRCLPNTRIEVADALRGLAVAGIVLFHCVDHFDIISQEPIAYTLPCDETVGQVLNWLLGGKMYGIFAMLFGLSFFIMNDNQQQKGRPFAARFAWRMCMLFMFGLVNVAFYDGDILMLYAVYGLLLIPASCLPSAVVWGIIVLLAIQPMELFCLLTDTTIDHTRLFDIYHQTTSLHEHGTFWENAVNNVSYGFELNFRYNIYSGRLTQLLCLFILGMQLGRQRLFYNEGRNVRIWHTILACSVIAVGILSIVDFGLLKTWLTPIYNLCILLMIVATVVSAWYASEGVRCALHHLCVYGRMSLTNYIVQSVIGCAIFYGYGMACYRLVGITYAVLIGVGIIIAQYFFCRYWLGSHRRGPLEDLWRRLTWIRSMRTGCQHIDRTVREARPADMAEIMKVVEAAKGIMRRSGNMLQWTNGYPSEDVIRADLEKHGGFLVEDAGTTVAYFAFLPSPEPTYTNIYGGQWIDDQLPYHVVHRIASYPHVHGIFNSIMDYCFAHDPNIRIDTHRDNTIMQHCIDQYGFTYCGIIYLDRRATQGDSLPTKDRDERLAYQKITKETIHMA